MWASWRRRLASGQTESLGVNSGVDGQHSSKEALGYLFPPTGHGQGRTWQA